MPAPTHAQRRDDWHHYFADTPDGAWAELLRHEEITTAEDAATVRRALWAVEIGDDPLTMVTLPAGVVTGGPETFGRCQAHARRLRARGVRRLAAASAALLPSGATGVEVVGGAERPAKRRHGRTVVVFGPPDGLVGWQAVDRGAPPPHVLSRVRHYGK